MEFFTLICCKICSVSLIKTENKRKNCLSRCEWSPSTKIVADRGDAEQVFHFSRSSKLGCLIKENEDNAHSNQCDQIGRFIALWATFKASGNNYFAQIAYISGNF